MKDQIKSTVVTTRANIGSLRTWVRGAFQSVVYGVASGFLSALGVNGGASLDLSWAPQVEPLDMGQLMSVMLITAGIRLAHFMTANPIFNQAE